MEKAYCNKAIEKYKEMMPEDKRKLLPSTMEDILCNPFLRKLCHWGRP
jgi:hypothetical protein